jgi:hypothetical protein
MPKFDGTGPQGAGPGTGRCFGFCNCPNFRGRGCGFGQGLGFRRVVSPKNQLAVLEDEEKMLEEELAMIRQEKEAYKKQK